MSRMNFHVVAERARLLTLDGYGHTTLFTEPVSDIAVTVIGIDRDGTVGVDQETSQFGNIVLRSA